MDIIKLDVTESTNSFLKGLVADTSVKSFTVVVADSQSKGNGQMGEKWLSESRKNLLFSVFIAHDSFLISDSMYLNYSVSLAIYKVLRKYKIKSLSIKWPNDILSGAFKIGGILIENTFCNSKIKNSIVGVGLNVNQVVFPKNLKKARSIKNILGFEINRKTLLSKLLKSIQVEVNNCKTIFFLDIKYNYLSVLYKRNLPSMFKDITDKIFIGKILGVSSLGCLQVELEDGVVKEFGLKEIRFLI